MFKSYDERQFFLHNGGRHDAFTYVLLTSKPLNIFLINYKSLLSYILFKCGNVLPISNCDKAQFNIESTEL